MRGNHPEAVYLFSLLCSQYFLCPTWDNKTSIELRADKPLHWLQIDSSGLPALRGVSSSVCLLPCCHASCCIPGRQASVIRAATLYNRVSEKSSPGQLLRNRGRFSQHCRCKNRQLFLQFLSVCEAFAFPALQRFTSDYKRFTPKFKELKVFMNLHLFPSRLTASITSKSSCGWITLISMCVGPTPSVLSAPT